MSTHRAMFGFMAVVFFPCAASPQGNPIGPEFRVNTYTTGNQGAPVAAADPSGNFVITWASFLQDGSNFGVFGQRYAGSGIPIGPEFRVNTYTTYRQTAPSVAADSSGNFVIVWRSYDQDGSLYGIFGQRFASSGTPQGPEFRVNTYTTGDQTLASVATDSAGNFVVVWSGDVQDGSNFGIFGQRYAGSGTPLGPEFRVNTYTTGSQVGGQVAVDPAGNCVVVWSSYEQDGSSFGVFGQRYDAGGTPLGPEFRVNTYTTASQGGASVAIDPSGNFVVVWTSGSPPFAFDIFGQRYSSSGSPLGPEFRVNTYTPYVQSSENVATDSAGNFVVVWNSSHNQDGSNYGVFGQRYGASGSPLGPEFPVNTYTTGNQFFPSVTSDPLGNFIVVWDGETQDGSSGGIFGQRYNMIVPVELMHFRVE